MSMMGLVRLYVEPSESLPLNMCRMTTNPSSIWCQNMLSVFVGFETKARLRRYFGSPLMAVTLDATLGGATSNSYIDMSTAVALAANIPGGGDWVALGEEERNLSLIVATRWLETLTYAGNRCAATQRLKWPRSGASCDGVVSDCTGIPYRIQEAEVTLAIKYTTDPGLFPGEAVVAGERLLARM